jgi:hypothetical protein
MDRMGCVDGVQGVNGVGCVGCMNGMGCVDRPKTSRLVTQVGCVTDFPDPVVRDCDPSSSARPTVA